MGLAAAPEPPPIDIAPAGPLPAPGGDSEVDILKSLVVTIGDYKSLLSVTEQERAVITKAEQIVQRLLAQNERMSDQATGASPALRKLGAL